MKTVEAKTFGEDQARSSRYGPRVTRSTRWIDSQVARKNLERAAVAALVALAAGFRVSGIHWGLPYLLNADETKDFSIAQRMLKQLDPNPHFFNYPSLFLYFNSAVEACYFAVCRALGLLNSLHDLPDPDVPVMGIGWTSLPSAFVTLRAGTILFGVAVVVIVYWIGLYLSKRSNTAVFAAMLVAASPGILENSRWITPEGMLTFVVTSTLLASLRVWRFGRVQDYVFASLLAGLAGSIKYNGALVGVSICAAAVIRDRWRAFRNPWLYLAPVIAICSFLVTTPYAVLDPEHFWRGLMFERTHYATGHAGAEGNTLAFYSRYLVDGEGVVALLSVAAVVLAIARRSAPPLIIATYCSVYFGFINTFVVRNGRTLVPIVPALLLLAAWFVTETFDWLGSQALIKRLPSTLRTALVAVLLILLVAHPLERSFQDTRVLLWKDNREIAHDWIEEHIAPHARIAIGEYSCYVNRHRYTLKVIKDVTKVSPHWLEQHADYLVLSSGAFSPYISDPSSYPKIAKAYQTLLTELEMIAHFSDPRGGDEIRVYQIRPESSTEGRKL